MQRSFRSMTGTTIAGIVLASGMMASPLWAQAQASTPPTAAPAKTMIAPAKVLDQMVSHYEHELVPLVEAMPADKYNFSPDSLHISQAKYTGVRTFAEQVKHVTAANYHFFSGLTSTPPPSFDPAKLKTKQQIVQALKDSFVYAHAAVATVTPQNAFQAIGHGEGGQTRMGMAAFAVAHGYNHYGQLVEYLRMNGIVPPASRK